MSELNIAGVIPARYGSTRFPGKSLALLGGRALILHVVDRAREAAKLDTLVVATDDERIADVVRADAVHAGHCEVQMTSPQCATGSDRVAEVARGRDWDIVVNIQGDEPCLDPGVIDALVQALIDDPDCGVATPVVPIADEADFLSPHVVKAVADAEGRALYFSRSPLPSSSRLTPSETRAETGAAVESNPDGEHFRWGMKHLGLYAFRTAVLFEFTQWPQTPLERREQLEQLRLLEHGVKIKIIETDHDSVGVDTPEELDRLNNLLEQLKAEKTSKTHL